MIKLLLVIGIGYLGMVNLAYFLFNPFFDYKFKYWSIYYLGFKLKTRGGEDD